MQNSSSTRWLLVVALMLAPITMMAQTSDFGLRFGAELSKKITKKLEIQVEEEVRFNNQASAFNKSMATLGGSYELNKTFKAGLCYTWIYLNNQNDGYYESRNRFGAWVQASKKVNRLKISLREKFQNTYRSEALGNYLYNPKMYLRSKLEIDYNIKKFPLDPYLSIEMQNQLNNPFGNVTDKWRFTAGTVYKISGKMDIDFYLRYEKEQNVKNPVNTTALGVLLKYSL